MQTITLGIATLAIATLYYIWRIYREVKCHREQVLRERVAFMLWNAALRREETHTPSAGQTAD